MSASRAAVAGLLGVLVALSSACTTTTPAGPVGAGTVPPAVSLSPSARPVCRSTGVAQRRFFVRADGVRRSYLLSAPDMVGGHPLVVLFHGYDQTASLIDAYTELPRAGVAAGFAVATPQGLDDRWNFPRRTAVGPDDVEFVRRMVAAIARRVCVDHRAVMVAGFSDGADMADTVGCFDRQIRAVAGVAASVPVRTCRHGVDVMQIHGDADPVVPFAGGGGDRPPPFQGSEAVSASRQMQRWRAIDGCSLYRSSHAALASGVTVVRSVGCRAGRRVVLVIVRDGGHTWPGARVNLPFGYTDHAYRATNRILNFFLSVDHGSTSR